VRARASRLACARAGVKMRGNGRHTPTHIQIVRA
jgi:hypothetical protein